MTPTDFLKCLGEGYIRCYRTLNVRTDSTYADLTQRELAFFARLGEMLGFAACFERQKMDLSWHDIDTKELVLYMERETEAGKALPEALRKLLESDKARFLVAVLGWVRELDLSAIEVNLLGQLGSALVIAWVGPNKDSATHLQLLVFSGAMVHRRQAIAEIDHDRYWYARFLENEKRHTDEVRAK
jgi:hypothetical protein